MQLDRSLQSRLKSAGQGWLVEYAAGRERLVNQLAHLDLDLVRAIRAGEGLADPPHGVLEPVPYVPLDQRGPGTEAAARGREALRAGRVGFVILAGGQASRLGYDGPKGEYPIGPRSERSLFHILIEQVMRGARDAGAMPPLAITTSSTTDAAIRAFFELHDCFGYPRESLDFACQRQLPALDANGRLILAEPDQVFTNPDGHGGALQALETSGILGRWQQAGIEYVATGQVDNPLLRVVDADFIGRLVGSAAPIATKIVIKTEPEEKVGVVARVAGQPALVEYSDLDDEDAARRDESGALTYRLGSIAAHVFDLGFLRAELGSSLPLHVAHKKIPHVDAEGNRGECNGTKYERFLFDLFPRAEEIVVCEIARAHEFSPLKNAKGVHSPDEVRDALDAQYRRWYAEAGATPPDESPLELSPLDVAGPDDLRDPA
jgi:UDP-N-acetylglucosamine/UDP-N-acetylgalactosamine diphosphorylase